MDYTYHLKDINLNHMGRKYLEVKDIKRLTKKILTNRKLLQLHS